MKKISAEIIADSVNPQGDRITSFILTYPRFIHSELMTHRLFSRNSASSRAIPFKKMVEDVTEDPFIPIAWQKDHKGMQGTQYITDSVEVKNCIETWLIGRDDAINCAETLHGDTAIFDETPDPYKPLEMGVTKQICNRVLEPFLWHTVLVTATEFDNFFELRCPQYKLIGLGGGPERSRKDWLNKMQYSSMLHPSGYPKTEEEWFQLSESSAEIHIQALAEAMWNARNESEPIKLKDGDWHIPFGDRIILPPTIPIDEGFTLEQGVAIRKVKIATARCARLSYMTFDGEMDNAKDLALHDTLLTNHHASPFEHCCRALTNEEFNTFGRIVPDSNFGHRFENGWVDNFQGFISYRRILGI